MTWNRVTAPCTQTAPSTQDADSAGSSTGQEGVQKGHVCHCQLGYELHAAASATVRPRDRQWVHVPLTFRKVWQFLKTRKLMSRRKKRNTDGLTDCILSRLAFLQMPAWCTVTPEHLFKTRKGAQQVPRPGFTAAWGRDTGYLSPQTPGRWDFSPEGFPSLDGCFKFKNTQSDDGY